MVHLIIIHWKVLSRNQNAFSILLLQIPPPPPPTHTHTFGAIVFTFKSVFNQQNSTEYRLVPVKVEYEGVSET